MQELENLNIAITAIQKDNVKLVNIGSTDINQGDLKIILGLLWTLIHHYHINQLDFDIELPNQNNDNKEKPKKEQQKNIGAKDKLLNIINEIIKPWGLHAKKALQLISKMEKSYNVLLTLVNLTPLEILPHLEKINMQTSKNHLNH